MAATNQTNTIHFSPRLRGSRRHALTGKTGNVWAARLAVDDGWLPASTTSSSMATESSTSTSTSTSTTNSWGVRRGRGGGRRRSRSLSSLLEEMREILPLAVEKGPGSRGTARRTTGTAFNPSFELPPLQPLLLPQPLSLRKDGGNRAQPRLVGADDVNNKFRLAGHTPHDNLTEKLACLSRPSAAPASTLPGPVNGNGNSNKKIDVRSKPLPSPPSPSSQPSQQLQPSSPLSDININQQQHQQHETRRRHETPQFVRGEHEVARLEAETNGTLAEQRKSDCDVQQQAHQHLQLSAVPPLTPLSATSPMGFSPMLDKFFSSDRRRRKSKTSPPTSPDSTPTTSQKTASPISPNSSLSQWSFFSSKDKEKDITSQTAGSQSPAQKIMPRHYIKAGGQTSTGARDSLTILCKNDFVDVAISRETTAHDVLVELKSLEQLAELSSGVLIEQYNAFGLERPLRRQERLRHVMDTWGPDSKNTLALSHDGPPHGLKLDLEGAPQTREAPPGFCLFMYYRGPGPKFKWVKRYIILYEDGRMIASKSSNPKRGDKDVVAICHLSDYDMYHPTEAQLRRHLKPPKRNVIAMKSQERINTFENTDKYVQYVSAEDKEIIRRFQSHVQAWRNWHLAKSLLREPEPEKPPQIMTVAAEPRRTVKEVGLGNGHKTRISVDESPYTIGAFKPLIDLDRFNKSIDDFGKDWTLVDGAERNDPSAAAAFPENSLLGAAYEERKQQLESKSATVAGTAGAGGRRAFPPTPAAGESGGSGSCFVDHSRTVSATDRRPQSPDSVRSIPRDAIPSTNTAARGRNEQVGWFASAAEHSRQQRSLIEQQQQQQQQQQQLYHQQSMPHQILIQRRPSTSAGSRMMGGLGRSVSQRRSHGNSLGSGGGVGHPVPLPQQQQFNQPASNPQPRRPMRQQPQPLLDLTPEFQEAPQWSRENKGRAVKPQDGRPLVDLATGPALVSGAAKIEQPPKALIHRSEQQALMMQRQQQQQQQQLGMRPGTSAGLQNSMVLGRRGTVRSSGGGIRPGTGDTMRSGGGYPPGGDYGRQRGMSLAGQGGGGGFVDNNGLGTQPDPRVMQYVLQQQKELQKQQQEGTRMGRLRTTSGGSQPQ